MGQVVQPIASLRSTAPRAATVDRVPSADKWLVAYLVLHLGCQVLLLVPAIASIRIIVRVAAFGASLALLVAIPGKRMTRLPVRALALAMLGIFCLEFFNPEGSGAVAGLAQVALNLAVLAPIFWVPRTSVTAATFQRLVTILWLYYSASAVFGVLQSYFPGHFQPQLSSVIASKGHERMMALQIRLASGERIFRPMGLTDTPGGAAYGGLYAVLLGTGLILLPKSPFPGSRFAAAASMMAGMMCLYLCQVRSLVVMTGIGLLTLFGLSVISGRISRLVGLLTALGAAVPVAFMLAVSLGGRSMTNRLATLTESDPGAVYYKHRGYFLEQAVKEYLPRYPLGAGLGRWGMIHSYFGTSGTLYVEIQWTAWLFDGGLPMVLLYLAAILLATWGCFKVALARDRKGDSSLSLWGAVLVAYNIGALALCFDYVVFIGTSGVEFWFLNSALLCAAQNSARGLFQTQRR